MTRWLPVYCVALAACSRAPAPATRAQPPTQPVSVARVADRERVSVTCRGSEAFSLRLVQASDYDISGRGLTPVSEYIELDESPLAALLSQSGRRAFERFSYATDASASVEDVSFKLAVQGPIPLDLPERCGAATLNLGRDGGLWDALSAVAVIGEESEFFIEDAALEASIPAEFLAFDGTGLVVRQEVVRFLAVGSEVFVENGDAAARFPKASAMLCNQGVFLAAWKATLHLCDTEGSLPPWLAEVTTPPFLTLEDVTLTVSNPRSDETTDLQLPLATFDRFGLRGEREFPERSPP